MAEAATPTSVDASPSFDTGWKLLQSLKESPTSSIAASTALLCHCAAMKVDHLWSSSNSTTHTQIRYTQNFVEPVLLQWQHVSQHLAKLAKLLQQQPPACRQRRPGSSSSSGHDIVQCSSGTARHPCTRWHSGAAHQPVAMLLLLCCGRRCLPRMVYDAVTAVEKLKWCERIQAL